LQHRKSRSAITDTEIIKIDDIEFFGEVVRRWRHSTVATAKIAPTQITGLPGAHGHTCSVESVVNFKNRSCKDPTPEINPRALKYPIGVGEASRLTTIAQEHENHEVTL
jgi:hypothetical protein